MRDVRPAREMIGQGFCCVFRAYLPRVVALLVLFYACDSPDPNRFRGRSRNDPVNEPVVAKCSRWVKTAFPCVSPRGDGLAFIGRRSSSSGEIRPLGVFFERCGARQGLHSPVVENCRLIAGEGESRCIVTDGPVALSGASEEVCFEAWLPGFLSRQGTLLIVCSTAQVDQGGRDSPVVVSRDSSGRIGEGKSFSPAMSYDGRYIAFVSNASNLVEGDRNDCFDVFVRDRDVSGDGVFDEDGDVRTIRVSVSSDGEEGNGPSGHWLGYEGPSISGCGRWIAFTSRASNFSALDADKLADVFVHNLSSGETLLVSTGQDRRSSANGECADVAISGDGRFVAFASCASNLVPGNPEGRWQVFLWDRKQKSIEMISKGGNGRPGNADSVEPALSVDGGRVAFVTTATNIVRAPSGRKLGIVISDRSTNRDCGAEGGWVTRAVAWQRRLPVNCLGERPSISGAGDLVAFQTTAPCFDAAAECGETGIVFEALRRSTRR